MNMQQLVNQMSAQWKQERSQTQMTLGKLITRLSQLPTETVIDGLGEPHSYRGYYSDLAFDGVKTTAGEALKMCQDCIGREFQGYKGGDYEMDEDTPVWRASYGCCGLKLMAVSDDGTLELKEDE